MLIAGHHPPGEFQARVGHSADHYNDRRYHESLDSLSPADICFVRASATW